MRPSDLTFAGEETLPQWAATLARQVADGGTSAPADVLSPIPLLEELLSVIDGMTRGHEPPQPADCRSLREDLKLACDGLGSDTAALHATTVKNFRAHIGQLDKNLATVPAALTLAPVTAVLLSELGSPDSRRAAFSDCVAAFKDLAPAGECELRLRQLRSFVVRAGHDWDERAKLIVDALADRVRAQTAAGAEPPADPSEWLRPAGMTLDERLGLATDLICANPRSGPVVVWLAYGNATVEPFHFKLGPLEFYDARIWRAALDGLWPGNPSWEQPVELADPDASLHLDGLPDSDFVVVRVELAHTATAEAAERARDLAEAALALTGWKANWLAFRGAACFTTHWFGSFGFVDPRQFPLPSNPRLDPVTSELSRVDESLLTRLGIREQAAIELVDDIRWRRDVRAAPSRDHRVALAVTLIERVLPAGSPRGSSWYEAATYYLKTLIAHSDLAQHVRDAGETTVHGRISARQKEPFPYSGEIIEHQGFNAFVVRADRVLARIDNLIAYADPETMEGRMLAEVKTRTSTAQDAQAWLIECERRFERLLARARRQRNAITHGTRTVAEVVSSVESFLDDIAGALIGALRESVTDNTSLATSLETYRLAWEKRKAALASGADPASQLFPHSH